MPEASTPVRDYASWQLIQKHRAKASQFVGRVVIGCRARDDEFPQRGYDDHARRPGSVFVFGGIEDHAVKPSRTEEPVLMPLARRYPDRPIRGALPRYLNR